MSITQAHTGIGRRTLAALGAAALGIVAAGALASADATPAAAASPPEVFSGFRNAALLSGSTPLVMNLPVPAGSYMIVAKASAYNGLSSSSPSHVVFCELEAGTDFDRSFSRIRPSDEQTLANTVVHTFTSPGTVRLECNDTTGASATTLMEFAKVTAIRVNAPISNMPL